jgi:hypothetical protein
VGTCDGHIESPTLQFLFADTSDDALVRWNRDHQPHANGWSLDLECADMSALWNDATCRVVGKRRHVAALQNSALYSPCLAAFLSLIFRALGGFIYCFN